MQRYLVISICDITLEQCKNKECKKEKCKIYREWVSGFYDGNNTIYK